MPRDPSTKGTSAAGGLAVLAADVETGKAIFADMSYLPTFRLAFPDGTFNEYRLNQDQLEFLTGSGTWRVLSEEDLNLHYILHTEVSKWLMRHLTDAQRTRTH